MTSSTSRAAPAVWLRVMTSRRASRLTKQLPEPVERGRGQPAAQRCGQTVRVGGDFDLLDLQPSGLRGCLGGELAVENVLRPFGSIPLQAAQPVGLTVASLRNR